MSGTLRQKLGKSLFNNVSAARAAPSHGAVVNYTQQSKDRVVINIQYLCRQRLDKQMAPQIENDCQHP